VALSGVTDELLDQPTPCADWTLADLLAHMSDGLDALTEASRGVIEVAAPPVASSGVGELFDKACHLLGAWTNPHAAAARLGAAHLESAVLLHAGALEITVHGWDVAVATGLDHPIPESLARPLHRSAVRLISPADRPHRFAETVETTGVVPPSALLLAFTGRPTRHPAPQTRLGSG
jgi:uncharacterized protein (TIGR03086 family)